MCPIMIGGYMLCFQKEVGILDYAWQIWILLDNLIKLLMLRHGLPIATSPTNPIRNFEYFKWENWKSPSDVKVRKIP